MRKLLNKISMFTKVQRAWGWYFEILRLPRFCLKVIRIEPYKHISWQYHTMRKEFWLFLTCGGVAYTSEFQKLYKKDALPLTRRFKTLLVKERQWHKVAAHESPLYAIEVQWGKRVIEKDIVRRKK